MLKKNLLSIAIITFFASCKVGPDYKKPEPQLSKSWIGAESQQNSASNNVKEWWQVFNDPILENLIKDAAEQNISLKIAKARIEEARASRSYAQGDLFPSIDASSTVTRNKQFFGPLGSGVLFNRFGASLNASWELDLFGGKRRALEAATADLEAIQEDEKALKISLFAEVARNYIELRNFQNQLQIANKNLAVQLEITELSEKQFEVGAISQIELLTAKTQLEIDQASTLLLESKIQSSKYNIEALLGKKPGYYESLLAEVKPVPVSNQELILKTPVQVISSRPDIRAVERRLASSTATQGIARSYQYPKVSLSALTGFESNNANDLISNPIRSWGIGGTVTMPIFQFGKIQSNIKIADKRQEQAMLQYQQIILEALRDVETNLIAYIKEGERLRSFDKAALSSKKIMELTEKRHNVGSDSLINSMKAKKNYYIYQSQFVNSKAATSSQLVTLYKSVGGFENSEN